VSNTSIISSLRSELEAFERKERSTEDFIRTLAGGFEALEGVSYATLQELRDFEHRFVKAQFADEDTRFEAPEVVIRKLRAALDEIKN